MFWTIVLLIAFGAVFLKLGAASVMVNVLTLGLQATLLMVAVLGGMLFWKSWKKPSNQQLPK